AESSADLIGGRITFGGVDTQNCDSEWSYTPNADGTGWSVSTGFSYGSKLSMPKKVEAVLESVISVIIGLPNAVDYIVVFTGAEYDFKSDAYVLPCSKVGTLPDMVFELVGGFEVRVPDRDYIRELPSNTKDQCTLMLGGDSFSSDQWWLGTTFGRPYCMQLDFENRRVGFAKVLD
ncbi:Protein ASP-7, partial [Aphelenchoides avenae]